MHERFEVVPRAAGGWPAVLGSLARLLERVPRDRAHVVIVERRPRAPVPRYVQSMVHSDGSVYAEAVSNDYLLPKGVQLDAAQDAALRELGWRAPDDPDHPAGSRRRNYWRGWPAPAARHEVAALVVVSLSSVYALADSEPLQVDVFPARSRRKRDAGRGGGGTLVVDLLRTKTDDELASWIEGCERRKAEELARGNGYAAWWQSKLRSSALTERRHRAGDAPSSGVLGSGQLGQ